MNKIFGDLKTDEEKSNFFLSGRGYETGVIAAAIQTDVAMAYHRCAEYKKELAALQAENDRLTRYYKNGIDCFANPCERHSGERTPPFSEFFERYGGQCLICVVDNNKTLQAKIEELKRALAESRANDLTAMGYLNQIRGLVGAADLPDMVRRCEKLRAECEKLRCIISDLKDWDCDVSAGFLSIPLDLRRRMQEAIDAAMQEASHDQ